MLEVLIVYDDLAKPVHESKGWKLEGPMPTAGFLTGGFDWTRITEHDPGNPSHPEQASKDPPHFSVQLRPMSSCTSQNWSALIISAMLVCSDPLWQDDRLIEGNVKPYIFLSLRSFI